MVRFRWNLCLEKAVLFLTCPREEIITKSSSTYSFVEEVTDKRCSAGRSEEWRPGRTNFLPELGRLSLFLNAFPRVSVLGSSIHTFGTFLDCHQLCPWVLISFSAGGFSTFHGAGRTLSLGGRGWQKVFPQLWDEGCAGRVGWSSQCLLYLSESLLFLAFSTKPCFLTFSFSFLFLFFAMKKR